MIVIFLLVVLADDAIIFEIEEEKDLEIILAEIAFLQNNPIDINTAGFDELIKIPYFTMNDCLKILEYRDRHGFYDSPYDLLNIPGFDPFTFEKVRPFITVKAKPIRLENFFTRLRLITEIPREELSEEYYTKTEFFYGQYNVFVVTEKDPHENSLFDYYALGTVIDDGVRKFALGKYNLDLGSGVLLSPVGSFFSSIDFRMISRERGIIPYTSVLENSGFFGAAFSDSLFLKFTLFYSNQKLDGRVDSLGFARSFDKSGEHVDSLSLSKKDRINEEIVGYDVRYRFSELLVSQRTYWCSYSPGFVCTDSLTEFYGENFWASSIELRYLGDFFIIFSECARSFENHIGGLFGISTYFPYIEFNLAGKYFPAGFYSPKGAEARHDYIGGTVDIRHISKIVNLGTTLTIDDKTDEDSVKYGLRFNFEKGIGFVQAKFQIRWRYAAETIDLSGSRVFLRLKPTMHLFFDVRLEEKYAYELSEVEKGIFGSLEVGTQFDKLSFRMRYGRFNTDSYASRIYVYESDLPGIINNRMLYKKGDYGFVYVSVKPVDLFKLSLKYSVVRMNSASTEQLGFQVDVKL